MTLFILLTLVYVTRIIPAASGISVNDFYSYQSNEVLPAGDDVQQSRSLSSAFPFFGQQATTYFVSTNGLISFNVEETQFTPRPFPTTGLIIAPYWADADATNGAGTVYFGVTTDSISLSMASQQIASAGFSGQQSFSPSYLIVVTWENVGYFSLGTDKRNTFQCVLVTDGTRSYAIFLYAQIQWTTGDSSGGQNGLASGSGAVPALVGFNAGDGVVSASVPQSNTDAIINITMTSNVGTPGVWMFRVDSTVVEAPDPCSPHPCHFNATCAQVGLSSDFTCTCPFPLTGDGLNTATGCIDINECTASIHDCVDSASCVDTDGSFTCICPLGSMGDGRASGIGCLVITVDIAPVDIVEPSNGDSDIVAATLTLSVSGGESIISDVVVSVTTSGRTATAGSDFAQSSPFIFTFTSGSANNMQVHVPVTIFDDTAVEAPEIFDLSVEVTPSSSASAGTPDTVAVTITDADSAAVTIVPMAVAEPTTGSQSMTVASLTLSTSSGGPLESDITVSLTPTGGSATTGGSANDFSLPVPYMVTFLSGAESGSTSNVSLLIIDDNFSEAPESFILSISVSSNAIASSGSPSSATVTITDTDMVSVGISAVAVTEPGSGGGANVNAAILTLFTSPVVTLESDVRVSVTAVPGTADLFKLTSPIDNDFFLSAQFEVTFLSGSGNGSTADVSIFVFDDLVVETLETLNLSISVSSSPIASVESPDSVIVTITDSDMAIVTIEAIPVIEPSADQNMTAASLTLTTSSGGALDAEVVVAIMASSLTATTEGTSDDFTLMSPHVVTFTAGSIGIVTANVSVMILNDEFVEGLETFELSISSVTSNVLAAVGDQESDVVTIRDNDAATIVISDVLAVAEPISSQNERVATLELFTSSGGELGTEVIVEVIASSETATVGDDFTLTSPLMVTFAAGATNGATANVSVMILDDDFIEGPETFNVSISDIRTDAMASTGNSDSTSVTIIDNDMASVTLTGGSVIEPTTDQDVLVGTLILSTSSGGALQTEIVVEVVATTGTAATNDFVDTAPFLTTFSIGAASGSTVDLSVEILNDEFVEGPEMFTLSIVNVTSDGLASAGDPDSETVTITDNDMATVTITAVAVTEPISNQDIVVATLILTTVSNLSLHEEVVVNVTASDGSADAGDFSLASPFTGTFFIGASDGASIDVPVMIFNDDFVEGPEIFNMSISSIMSTAMVSAGGPESVSVTITDNDIATVTVLGMVLTEPNGSQSLPVASLTLSTSSGGSLDADVVVTVLANPGSADVAADFSQAVPFLATFTVGTNHSTFMSASVMVLDDDFVEGNETFTVSINVTSVAIAVPGTQASDTVTIIDNDVALITVEPMDLIEPSSDQLMTAATLTLTTTSGGALEADVTVTVLTYGGTATTGSGRDDIVQATPFVVNFSSGSADGTVADVSVMILNDDFVEGPETFDLLITEVTSNAEVIVTSPNITAVTIRDNDMATVLLSDMVVTEPGSSENLSVAVLMLSTSSGGELETEIVIDVTAEARTATTGGNTDDFTPESPFVASFSVGSKNNDTANISVMILNDDFVEGPETFDLFISNITSDAIIIAGNPVTVIIIDNDMATVTFGNAPVMEPRSNQGRTEVPLLLSTSSGGSLEVEVVVSVIVTAGTTTAGSASGDFAPVSSLFATFTIGSTNGEVVNVSVIILNDDFVEGPETIDLSIANVSSEATAVAGDPDTQVVTIIDNDIALVTILADSEVSEPDSDRVLPVANLILSTSSGGILDAEIIVEVTASAGTASTGGADSDFTLITFFATFAAGAASGTITNVSVMILNDDFIEGPETFDLSISNVTSLAAVSTGNSSVNTVTILDNDVATVTITGLDVVELDSDSNVTVAIVTLTTSSGGSLQADVFVSVIAMNGTASMGDFLLPTPYVASFLVGAINGATTNVSAIIFSDDLQEGEENFYVSISNVTSKSMAFTGLNDTDSVTISNAVPPFFQQHQTEIVSAIAVVGAVGLLVVIGAGSGYIQVLRQLLDSLHVGKKSDMLLKEP